MTVQRNQVHQAPSDNGIVVQEQSLPKKTMLKDKKDFDNKTIIDKTVGAIEKGIRAIDPLHIFAPCVQPTRLVVKTGLYSPSSVVDAFPIVECRTGNSFQDLEIKSMVDNDLLVVQESTTGATVVVIERTGEHPNVTYQIFKTTAAHKGQEPVKKHQGVDLYALAKVERNSPRDLDVFMNNETKPTYTIEKAGILANCSTNYYIKQQGVNKKAVASTHPWEGKNDMLVVTPGMDILLMLCLGIIANDAGTSRSDSFSDEATSSIPSLFSESSLPTTRMQIWTKESLFIMIQVVRY